MKNIVVLVSATEVGSMPHIFHSCSGTYLAMMFGVNRCREIEKKGKQGKGLQHGE